MNPPSGNPINLSEDYWRRPCVIEWTQDVLDSYAGLVKKELISREGTPVEQTERLFKCSFVVASHGLQDDPILNYGNQTALDLWEMDWERFTQTPSRLTAEPMNREARARMLEQAKTQGYISDYQGIRISGSGKRFLVERATVWNIHKPDGTLLGQAAAFADWTYL